MFYFSKSKYCDFCDCPMLAWLNRYKPEEYYIDDATKARMEMGSIVGDIAMGYFGDYVEVSMYNGEKLDLNRMIERTKQEIAKNTPVICEASFEYNGLYCAVDILKKENGGWAIYEVKSSTHTDKPRYINDVAYQKYVLEKCGINVTGLSEDSKQGDRAILDFLKLADSASSDTSAEWDCTDTPDIAPYMAVVSAFSFGKMVLKGTGRLRIKESDRVMAVREQLLAAGVKTEETEDTLTIFGYSRTEGYEEPLKLSSYHDHRMAMCAILIAVILKVKVGIDDTECLNKSFPELREMIGKEMT